jgi:hypothetical protein
MKNKIKVAFTAILLPVIILLLSFGEQHAEWKGKIDVENGIKIIKNPKEPLYGEITFELKEDLSIGNESDENYLFYRVREVQVDPEGNIYVLDSGNHRLQVFDKNSNYLCTIGKKGEGPGEFNGPACLQLDDETGHIFVADFLSRKIITFDKEGRHIDKDIHLVEYLDDFYLDSERCIWGKFSLPGTDTYRFIKKVSLAGKVEKTFTEIPFYINRVMAASTGVGNKRFVTGYFITHGYEDDLFLSKVDNHTFVYGHSKKYELIAVDETGNTLFMIRKDEAPKEITKKEKDRIENQEIWNIRKQGHQISELSLKFPEHMPFFFSIITDDKSRIYVRKNPYSRGLNTNHEYDVFSKDGRYLYKTHLNHYPDVIRNRYLYTLIVNEETGLEQIKRYKIKNWDQIKTGI